MGDLIDTRNIIFCQKNIYVAN